MNIYKQKSPKIIQSECCWCWYPIWYSIHTRTHANNSLEIAIRLNQVETTIYEFLLKYTLWISLAPLLHHKFVFQPVARRRRRMWSDLLFYSKQVFLFVGLTKKKKKKMMWEDKWLLVMVETIVDLLLMMWTSPAVVPIFWVELHPHAVDWSVNQEVSLSWNQDLFPLLF